MPSSSLLASLGHPDLSLASTPSPPTSRNDLDGKEKQRLLRQASKLSQILGELQATVAPTRPVRDSTPAVLEVPPTGLSQLHVPSSSGRSFTEPSPRSPRFSPMAHTVAASTMSPSLLPPVHDDSNRTVPRRRSSIIPAHINQLDLTRFGLGRRDWSGSMRASSAHSDDNASHTDQRPLVAETQSDLSDLHSLENVHVTRPRNKPRWRSVYNLNPMEFGAHPRSSGDSPMSACSSKRGVSLWTKRRASNEGQRCPLADQGQEGITSGMPLPLTESQRVLSIRRGRKLTQVFGTEPPIALYRAPSHVEDVPTTSDAIQRERTKTYLALSSGDLRSANSQRSSRHRSHSSLSSADSILPPSPHPTMNDVEIECELTSPHPLSGPDEDPEAQCSRDGSGDGEAFRRRRLRAAKLSRFFGVTYNDLTGPIGIPVKGRQDNGEEVISPQAQATEVGVRIDGPGWFWNRTDSNHGSEGAQDADMNAAIALLRQMPRA
ncbi:hypothetical protein EDB87DRAFT_1377339 [Lactarius vividus]|nr:hypothetical protein EDB87DRAFT_1377339 [Lactarius vividus]